MYISIHTKLDTFSKIRLDEDKMHKKFVSKPISWILSFNFSFLIMWVDWLWQDRGWLHICANFQILYGRLHIWRGALKSPFNITEWIWARRGPLTIPAQPTIFFTSYGHIYSNPHRRGSLRNFVVHPPSDVAGWHRIAFSQPKHAKLARPISRDKYKKNRTPPPILPLTKMIHGPDKPPCPVPSSPAGRRGGGGVAGSASNCFFADGGCSKAALWRTSVLHIHEERRWGRWVRRPPPLRCSGRPRGNTEVDRGYVPLRGCARM